MKKYILCITTQSLALLAYICHDPVVEPFFHVCSSFPLIAEKCDWFLYHARKATHTRTHDVDVILPTNKESNGTSLPAIMLFSASLNSVLQTVFERR
jgi:hypothetical protein